MIRANLPDLQTTIWSHRNFETALNLVQSLAVYSPKGSMILVTGASGVGKSTLLKKLCSVLVAPERDWLEGYVPIATTPICNDVKGLFNSKNFVLRLLDAIHHPIYGLPRSLEGPAQSANELALERIRLIYSEPHLWLVLEKAIHYRQTQFILLDEAQHLIKAGSERKAVDNLDCVKGLAERTGTIIILFGTFEILPIWNRSAQLNRRLHDVVLQRYFDDDEEDAKEFLRILETFSRKLPLGRGLSLLREAEFIYEHTLGIVGEVFRLLIGAYARMHACGRPAITTPMLRDSVHSPEKLETLYRETTSGEAMLNGRHGIKNLDIKMTQRALSVRPGRRKPTRDPVGSMGKVT